MLYNQLDFTVQVAVNSSLRSKTAILIHCSVAYPKPKETMRDQLVIPVIFQVEKKNKK